MANGKAYDPPNPEKHLKTTVGFNPLPSSHDYEKLLPQMPLLLRFAQGWEMSRL